MLLSVQTAYYFHEHDVKAKHMYYCNLKVSLDLVGVAIFLEILPKPIILLMYAKILQFIITPFYIAALTAEHVPQYHVSLHFIMLLCDILLVKKIPLEIC